jgi:hypothetical protein
MVVVSFQGYGAGVTALDLFETPFPESCGE